MRVLLRIFLILLLVVVLIVGGLTGYAYFAVRRMLPQTSGTLSFRGLDGRVEVYRDSAGVPHIYASTVADLFFAQGIVHAQDRWWQMEFNRHTALGRIGELTGYNERILSNDVFIRTVGWNRSAQADLQAASPEALNILNSYADGINAYLGNKDGSELAVEYTLLNLNKVRIPIERWEPLHSVAWANAMAWNLGGNWDVELELAELYKTFEKEAQGMIDTFEPAYPFKEHLPIIREGEFATTPEMIANPPLVAPGTDLSHINTQLVGGATPQSLYSTADRLGLGSNNWVISGKRTVTGKPILANDPHLSIQMPAIWYQVGLHCIEVNAQCPYDVEGFSFPGIPGIIIGHNSRIAWGVTNVGPDTQDLYIIDVDPNNSTKYTLDGKLEDMQTITETIVFGDGTPAKDVQVRITKWGPIISDATNDMVNDKPVALRWDATEKPKHIIDSVLRINQASDWDSFRTALKAWDAPSQNFVYADVDGNIGYQTPGRIIIRAQGHSGLTPVDGSTSKYNWKGYIPFEKLPSLYNPDRGYISTANQAVVPPNYYEQLARDLGGQFGADSNYAISYNWAYGYRGQRISDLIEQTDKHTIDSVAAIHGDNYNGGAAQLLPFIIQHNYPNGIPAEFMQWMSEWDYQNNPNSGQAAMFEMFMSDLAVRLWGDQLGWVPSNGGGSLWQAAHLLLDQPTNIWWDDINTKDRVEQRDDILGATFRSAYDTMVQRYGADYKKWEWGKLHTATFVSNPIGQSGVDVIEKFVNYGPVTVGGGSEIVNATGYRFNQEFTFEVRSIPSMRMIVDLNDFNNSRWIVPTGASGHPTSDHYHDQTDKWATIQYLPMYWSKDTIAKNASNTLILEPKS